MNPIKWLLTKNEPATKELPVSDIATEPAVLAPQDTTEQSPVVTETDMVLAKLKKLMQAAGPQSVAYFDEFADLAKKTA